LELGYRTLDYWIGFSRERLTDWIGEFGLLDVSYIRLSFVLIDEMYMVVGL